MSVTEMRVEEISEKISVFRSILMATDLSEASHPALSCGIALGARYDSRLSVVHVFHADWRYEMLSNPPEIDLERMDARKQLDAMIRKLRPDRKVDSIMVKGSPVAKAVLSAITRSGADLLLIGTHGRGGLSKLALGSVAEVLLRTAPCPVMTIGPKAAIDSRGADFRAILFATDFGAASTKALPLVVTLARAHQAKLFLLHMIPPMPTTSSSLSAYAPAAAAAEEVQEWEAASGKRSRQQLREWFMAQARSEQEPEYIVGTDFVTEGILTAASKFKIGLIVMGTNDSASPRVAAHLPWTAVHEVIHDAPCPVLTVGE